MKDNSQIYQSKEKNAPSVEQSGLMANIIGLAQAKEVANLTWRDLFVITWETIVALILVEVWTVGKRGQNDCKN
ncbi:hypothetical protein BOW92_gp140 [Synechococcus phage S-WAM1]|uniref:Uncharacterized protein n=1 Tax=Synechococcus phage S-WAM1 TaxID=1815521 RepID=A0A1D8KSM2_9CAUD|nr:hypothetical protein BOW92_gp140 [Synechococcus phage S-WAM1]AOV61577.1 hypothetical protein P090810_104 [Synechococcus phage S-WAM1]